MSSKFTRQGVRDLNSLPGKSNGRKLMEPPIVINCKHKNRKSEPPLWEEYCVDCGQMWDWNGKAI